MPTGLNKSNNSHYSTSNSCAQAADSKKLYDTDTQTLARWLDVGIVKKKGRAFAADKTLLPAVDAVKFPSVKGTNLYSESVVVPESFNSVSDALINQTDGKTGEHTFATSATFT
jgi:hypothetical protein